MLLDLPRDPWLASEDDYAHHHTVTNRRMRGLLDVYEEALQDGDMLLAEYAFSNAMALADRRTRQLQAALLREWMSLSRGSHEGLAAWTLSSRYGTIHGETPSTMRMRDQNIDTIITEIHYAYRAMDFADAEGAEDWPELRSRVIEAALSACKSAGIHADMSEHGDEELWSGLAAARMRWLALTCVQHMAGRFPEVGRLVDGGELARRVQDADREAGLWASAIAERDAGAAAAAQQWEHDLAAMRAENQRRRNQDAAFAMGLMFRFIVEAGRR